MGESRDIKGLYGSVKLCSRCGETKPIDEFGWLFGKRSHLKSSECIACVALRRKAYYEANKEREREQNRRWHQENKPWKRQEKRDYINAWRRQPGKRRAEWANRDALERNAEGSFTQLEWDTLCEKYNNECLSCGATGLALSVDHVVPLSLGGTNYIDNIQPLCMPCNSSKGARTIDYRS